MNKLMYFIFLISLVMCFVFHLLQMRDATTGQAEFIAFGTFDIVADENVDNFNQYFESKFSGNDTLFPKLMDDVMNEWFRSDNAKFEAVSVTIEETFDKFVAEPEDTFKNTALDVTYGLYGFMAFCLLLAILGSVHANIIATMITVCLD